MGDDLARALERRSLRARQAGIATAAALLVVLARHASPDVDVTAVAGPPRSSPSPSRSRCRAARRARALDRRPGRRVAPARARGRRSLERLAALAERGAAEPRQTRPPRSVLELAPEAAAIRELAALLRAHPEPPVGVVAACDRFADHCWNGALRGLDHELLRRELGRVRFALAR